MQWTEEKQKLKDQHWRECDKEYEQVEALYAQGDWEAAEELLEQLAEKEKVWLKEHPGMLRYYSPLNTHINPIVLETPDYSICTCKDCILAAKGAAGYMKSNCQVYPSPNVKPEAIVWSGARCPYKISKKDAERAKKSENAKGKGKKAK